MTGESAMHENAAGAADNHYVRGPERARRAADISAFVAQFIGPADIVPPSGQGQITAAGRCRARLAARSVPSE
ncbi:hypothetical protein GFL21_07585 [Rhizobium anhuiense]|nr:hypothetical protein [Rhizobium anhuiense]